VIPILKTPEELKAGNDRIMDGKRPTNDSVNAVKDVPENFKRWVRDNEDRITVANNRGTLPNFLINNTKYTDIDVNRINTSVRHDIRTAAKKKFMSYNSENWSCAYFDEFSGGYNVYHKEHQFTPAGGGGEAEKKVGKMLAKYNGKQVEFLAENGKGKSVPDIKFDNATWDIKLIDKANENTIRKYIRDARKADNAIFYFEDKNKYKELRNAIDREVGKYRKKGEIEKLPDVYYIDETWLLKLLWGK
jgi:hypothetical protein